MINFLRVVLILAGLSMAAPFAIAADLLNVADLEIDRVPGTQGLTGLLRMNSAYTLRAGEVRLHATAFYYDEKNLVVGAPFTAPLETTYIEMPISLTMGVTDNFEIAFVGKLIDYELQTSIDLGPPFGVVAVDLDERDFGDSEVLIKVHVLDQSEFAPAFALGLGAILGTGDEDKLLTGVDAWGAKMMAMASVELPLFEDSFLGMYLELQGVSIDPSEDDYDAITSPDGSIYKDSYNIVSAGIRFPISNDNRLHFMAEFSSETGRERLALPTLPGVAIVADGDRNIMTVGLRYAWRYMTFNAGAEKSDYDLNGVDDITRYFLGFGLGI